MKANNSDYIQRIHGLRILPAIFFLIFPIISFQFLQISWAWHRSLNLRKLKIFTSISGGKMFIESFIFFVSAIMLDLLFCFGTICHVCPTIACTKLVLEKEVEDFWWLKGDFNLWWQLTSPLGMFKNRLSNNCHLRLKSHY